ncbi:50S ribosomal protein L4 [candidate division NPL-UPA2 bacterium Unc8]|uniref:Large ribosomal subunit protein uL4 n=1 Tax=candidate division NPL-UPA2 bacterium Unc8 TaxID=1980939 RepID=A0A399FYM3_UNCN2|nr:50S ribosomal protein L4 [Bacillota bacterium]MBT9147249.1 50S ribosomal protein L4 [Bacillota bacterium]RII00303.1 MAG: 50S ribosomal protein L4 [candidate division NPL-UPA2 bacterium Unc8]
MENVDLYNIRGEVIGKISLLNKVFDASVNEGLLYQAVRTHLSRQRRGTASTKRRSEVSGSRRKPWRQKGTGRARAGTRQSPIWRGGGVAFGPQPRDYSLSVLKRQRKSALVSALMAKMKEDGIIVVDRVNVEKGKTKEMASILHSLNIKKKVLLVVTSGDDLLKRSARNIKRLNMSSPSTLNAYEILSHDKLILTVDALEAIESIRTSKCKMSK